MSSYMGIQKEGRPLAKKLNRPLRRRGGHHHHTWALRRVDCQIYKKKLPPQKKGRVLSYMGTQDSRLLDLQKNLPLEMRGGHCRGRMDEWEEGARSI